MENKYADILIDRIKSLCSSRGITIYQLSIMSGISYSTLDNLMNKHTFNPRIQTLHKIALAFGMTLAEFLDFRELNLYSFDE